MTVREVEYVWLTPATATVAVEAIAALVLQSTTNIGIDGRLTHKLMPVVAELTEIVEVEFVYPLAIVTKVKLANPGTVQEYDELAGTVTEEE